MKQHSHKLYAQVCLFRWLVLLVTWNSWCVNCFHASCTVHALIFTLLAHLSRPAQTFHTSCASFHSSCKVWIRHLHISHNAPYLRPQILHNLCFSFPQGITAVPREFENNAYAKLWAPNKVHYGRCASGVSSSLAFSAILTVSNIYK